MSMNTRKIPLRERHRRAAKDKASDEITKYFKPRKPLQNIPENDEIVFQNLKKHDKNNNTAKRLLEDKNNNESNEAKKIKVITSTPLIQNGGSSNGSSSDQSASITSTSDDIVVVLDSSIDSNNSVLVDSLSVNENNKKYNFDALQTDDPTESDEDESNAPYWSLYHNRRAIVIDQIAAEYKTIDKFFGCKFETVHSRDIFPETVRIARRRSTAVWNTPPRYSMMPKY